MPPKIWGMGGSNYGSDGKQGGVRKRVFILPFHLLPSSSLSSAFILFIFLQFLIHLLSTYPTMYHLWMFDILVRGRYCESLCLLRQWWIFLHCNHGLLVFTGIIFFFSKHLTFKGIMIIFWFIPWISSLYFFLVKKKRNDHLKGYSDVRMGLPCNSRRVEGYRHFPWWSGGKWRVIDLISKFEFSFLLFLFKKLSSVVLNIIIHLCWNPQEKKSL